MSRKRWWRAIPLWVWGTFISALLLFGLPILGFTVGFRSIGAAGNAAVGRWRSLGAPPVRPAGIVDASPGRIHVRGEDGSLLECDHTGPTRDNACWKKAEQPVQKDGRVELGVTYRGEIPPLPGPMVEALDLVFYQYAESATYMRYALLEDGSVWVWEHHADANTSLLVLFAGPVCGLALAIVIVVVMWLVIGGRAALKKRKTSDGA